MASPLLFLGVVIVGILIGAVGVGGVLLAPLIMLSSGIQADAAIATSMFCYVLSGVAGVCLFVKNGSISLRPFWPLIVAAAIGALLASAFLTLIPARMLVVLMAVTNLAAAWMILRTAGSVGEVSASNHAYWIAGGATGLFSALSGTSGPAILVPIMLSLSTPLTVAIGVGQVVQLPIGAVATMLNVSNGLLDVSTALPIAVLLFLGSLIGGRFATTLSLKTLSRVAAFAYSIAGVMLTIKAVA